jgi:hypothetical protein
MGARRQVAVPVGSDTDFSRQMQLGNFSLLFKDLGVYLWAVPIGGDANFLK